MKTSLLFVTFTAAVSIGLVLTAASGSPALAADSPDSTVADSGTPETATPSEASTSSQEAGPPSNILQDQAEIERVRAEKQRAVTAAAAKVEDAKKHLLDVKTLVVDVQDTQRRLSEAKTSAQFADASADAKNRVTDLQTSLLAQKKQLLQLDLNLVVDSDAGDGFDTSAAIKRAENDLKAATDAASKASAAAAAFEQSITDLETKSSTLKDRLVWARRARCKTAYCFGREGTEYAIEPMLKLPIGTSVAIGDGALARFNNATELSLQFSAGVRLWMLYDYFSVAMYFAKPIYSGDTKVHVPGSSFEHPTTSIRRVGPSIALGFFGDILFIGAGYDVLRNGSTPGSTDPNYAPNQVIARAITLSFGIAPFAAIRNVAGAAGAN